MQKVLIDTFVVPGESKAAFVEQTRRIQSFLKTLPGFIEGYMYEKAAGENRINFVTIAVWQDDASYENARKAALAEFQRIGLNPQEIVKKLNVESGRAVYTRTPY